MWVVHPESSLTFDRDGDVYRFSGALNHLSDLKPLLNAAPPLRMDWRGIQSVSSSGIRLWMEFLARWGDKPMEISAVTPPLVSMINAVPGAVGPMGRKETIRSVLVPYSCRRCNRYMELEVSTSTVLTADGELLLPEASCVECGEAAELVMDPDEYFLFLVWKPGL